MELRAAARLPSDVAAAAVGVAGEYCGPDCPERRAALHHDRETVTAGRIGPRRRNRLTALSCVGGGLQGCPRRVWHFICGKYVWSRRRGTRGGGRRGLPPIGAQAPSTVDGGGAFGGPDSFTSL